MVWGGVKIKKEEYYIVYYLPSTTKKNKNKKQMINEYRIFKVYVNNMSSYPHSL